jgi:hypothetical protein
MNQYSEFEVRLITTIDQVSDQLSRIIVLLQNRFGVRASFRFPEGCVNETTLEAIEREIDKDLEWQEDLENTGY